MTDAGKAMRVLVVGNYAGDRQQSMLRYGRTLVAGLRAAGIDADLIAPAMIVGHRLGARAAKWAGYVDKFLLFPWRLWWRAGDYDLVHIADHSNAPYQAWRRGKPLVLTCHDLFAVGQLVAAGGAATPPLRWSGRLLQRWILASLRRCRDISCVSAATAADVRRLAGPSPRVEVIPNAVDAFYRPVPDDEARALLRAAGLDDAIPFFLHVGGNQFYKNRPGVVRVFEALAARPSHSTTRLVLAGKPPDAALAAAIARSRVRDRIITLVEPRDETVRALYAGATALLFLSLQEGFGWPVLEAQACGCRVVTTDAEPMRSILGGGGVLVDPQDPEAAADRIVAAEDDWPAYQRRAAANVARYSIETVIEAYIGRYRRIMSREASADAAPVG